MKDNIIINFKLESLNKINPLISRYECNVAAVDVKANSFIFHKGILEKLIPTLKGSPILTYYSENDDKFAGHEGDYYQSNKTGKIEQTPELRAIGFVDYQSEPKFKIINDEDWLTCICYLWDGRYPYLQNLSERNDIWQSMEVCIDYNELPDGSKEVTDAILIGLALIGIEPAFTGSTFKSFSQNNVQNELLQLKNEFERFKDKYSELDFTIPKTVKSNAQNGLDLREENGRGGTSVGLNTAKYLVKNTVASPEKVRHIAKYFPRHAGDNLDDKTSNGWIAWQLWGGNAGRSWSTKLVESMNKIDEDFSNAFMSCNEELYKNKQENINMDNFSVGKELGKYSSIEIDNNPKNAIHADSWEGQDAGFLNKLLKASNHTALIKENYAKVKGDSSGDLSVNDVGYEHHSIKDNKLVLNVAGVQAAYKRAKQQGETGEIMSHIDRHRNTLGLNNKVKEDDKMSSFSKKDIKEKLSKEFEACKYSVEEKEMCKYSYITHDEEFAYVVDKENGKKLSAIPYSISTKKNENDEEVEEFSVDFSNMKFAMVKCGVKSEKSEDSEDDDEVYMALMSIFSSDENVDTAAAAVRREKEAEQNKKIAEMNDQLEKYELDLSKLQEENSSVKTENEKLKTDINVFVNKEKIGQVESVLSEVSEDLDKEKIDSFRKEADNFSLENLNIWANSVRAYAFSISKQTKNNENITRMGLPNAGSSKDKKGLWD